MGTILEYVVIGIVAVTLVILVLWLVMRHRKHRSTGRELGGEKRGRRVGRRSSRQRSSTAPLDYDLTERRPATQAAGASV